MLSQDKWDRRKWDEDDDWGSWRGQAESWYNRRDLRIENKRKSYVDVF